MTREEFDAELNVDTLQGLEKDRVRYRLLSGLAAKYGRPDIVSVLDDIVTALSQGVMAAEHLTVPAAKECS